MKIKQIIWLPDFEDKLYEKHSVSVDDVEEALFNSSPPHIRFMEKGSRKDEDLYAAYGQTIGGRYLVIFFILKSGNAALVISARDMDRKERRRYGRRKGK